MVKYFNQYYYLILKAYFMCDMINLDNFLGGMGQSLTKVNKTQGKIYLLEHEKARLYLSLPYNFLFSFPHCLMFLVHLHKTCSLALALIGLFPGAGPT